MAVFRTSASRFSTPHRPARHSPYARSDPQSPTRTQSNSVDDISRTGPETGITLNPNAPYTPNPSPRHGSYHSRPGLGDDLARSNLAEKISRSQLDTSPTGTGHNDTRMDTTASATSGLKTPIETASTWRGCGLDVSSSCAASTTHTIHVPDAAIAAQQDHDGCLKSSAHQDQDQSTAIQDSASLSASSSVSSLLSDSSPLEHLAPSITHHSSDNHKAASGSRDCWPITRAHSGHSFSASSPSDSEPNSSVSHTKSSCGPRIPNLPHVGSGLSPTEVPRQYSNNPSLTSCFNTSPRFSSSRVACATPVNAQGTMCTSKSQAIISIRQESDPRVLKVPQSVDERLHVTNPPENSSTSSDSSSPIGDGSHFGTAAQRKSALQFHSLDSLSIPWPLEGMPQAAAAVSSAISFDHHAKLDDGDEDARQRYRLHYENGLPTWIHLTVSLMKVAQQVELRYPMRDTSEDHENAAIDLRRLFEEMSMVYCKKMPRSIKSTTLVVSDMSVAIVA